MRQIIPAWCALGVLIGPGLAGGARPAEAAGAREETLLALAQASGRIFVGTARRVHYQRDPRSGLVYTHVTFDRVTLIKGRPPGPGAPLVLQVAGGVDEGDTLVQVAGIPQFQAGERYVVFQKAGPWTFCPLTGWDQGCYHLVRRKAALGARRAARGGDDGSTANRFADYRAERRAPSAQSRSEATTWVVLDARDTPILGVRGGRLQRPRPRGGAPVPGGGAPMPGQDRMSMFGAAIPGARPGLSGDDDAVRLHDPAGGAGMAPPVGEAPPAITRYVGRKRASTTVTRRPTRPPAGAMSAAAFLAEVRSAAAETASRRSLPIEDAPSPLRTRAVSTSER
jgi:hypothetical protein